MQRVRVETSGGIARLSWIETPEVAALEAVCADCLGDGARRVEAAVSAGDLASIHALHRAGFRREGRRRQAVELPDGELADELLYSRLTSDIVGGPDGFSSVMDSVLATKRVIAHVLFTDDDGRVLLLETTYKSDWELPGGIVERGETPREGAEREVAEEIGLDVRLGQPQLVDWLPPYLGWSDALEFLYLGGVLDHAEVGPPELGEIVAPHWVPPHDVASYVTPLSARRIALLLDGKFGFTRDGYLVDP